MQALNAIKTYEQIASAADLIVNRKPIRDARIGDLRSLIESVQNHQGAAVAEISDTGTPTLANPTALILEHCRIDGCCLAKMIVGIQLKLYNCNLYGIDFQSCHFCSEVRIENSRVKDDAYFCQSDFHSMTTFRRSTFFQRATFAEVRFSGHPAFCQTDFQGDVLFHACAFPRGANFYGATFPEKESEASFDASRIAGNLNFSTAAINGPLSLQLHESKCSILLEGACFGHDARIRLSETTFREGSVIKLPKAWIAAESLSHADCPGAVRDLLPPESVLRITLEYFMAVTAAWRENVWPWLRRRLGIRSHGYLIHGEDSGRRADLLGASAQYNLLRDNFRRQPSTDELEDLCHFRYMELRRKTGDFRGQAKRWDASGKQRRMTLAEMIQWLLVDGVFYWLIWRNCVGYLVRPMRPLFTAIILVVVCALIYSIGASDSTILYNGQMDPGKSAMEYWNASSFTALYFSVTTFTTLGYGDFAPTGWLRLVAGVQAVLGVTLIALFTVSWGRKMIR
ncbi:MAG: hypothetical protein EA380_02530 [Phycisphaeraceae bacterium]|nr:MAG: hypothetical protein EA380_02530 [Phycisphaeraceae bacterium]